MDAARHQRAFEASIPRAYCEGNLVVYARWGATLGTARFWVCTY